MVINLDDWLLECVAMETVKYYIDINSVDRLSPLTLDVVKLVGMETEKHTMTIDVAVETSCCGKSLLK